MGNTAKGADGETALPDTLLNSVTVTGFTPDEEIALRDTLRTIGVRTRIDQVTYDTLDYLDKITKQTDATAPDAHFAPQLEADDFDLEDFNLDGVRAALNEGELRPKQIADTLAGVSYSPTITIRDPSETRVLAHELLHASLRHYGYDIHGVGRKFAYYCGTVPALAFGAPAEDAFIATCGVAYEVSDAYATSINESLASNDAYSSPQDVFEAQAREINIGRDALTRDQFLLALHDNADHDAIPDAVARLVTKTNQMWLKIVAVISNEGYEAGFEITPGNSYMLTNAGELLTGLHGMLQAPDDAEQSVCATLQSEYPDWVDAYTAVYRPSEQAQLCLSRANQ